MSIVSKINKTARELSTIDRYSQTRLINPESVLEHTGFVCLCSLLIGIELEKSGEKIHFGKLLTKATLHDIEETITGDISCPTKYANESILREVKKVEEQAAEQICTNLDPDGHIFRLWAESKEGKEGFIVALADKLAVVYKVQQEVEYFGNKTLNEHINGLPNALWRLNDKAVGIFENRKLIYSIILEAITICEGVKK